MTFAQHCIFNTSTQKLYILLKVGLQKVQIETLTSLFFFLSCIMQISFYFTDGQYDKEAILSMLSKKDFGSFRKSVRREHVSSQFSGKKTLLHCAVASGDSESVEHILNLGAEVNCTTAKGYTPLVIAVLQRWV